MYQPSFLVLTTCAVLGLGSAAPAGPIVDAATMAETKVAAKDMAGALEAAREAVAQVWDQSPTIGFTQAQLVSEYSPAYGVYNARPSNVFKMGDPILIYCEPWGMGYGTPGAGIYSVNLIVDLQVLDAAGNQLANVPDTTEYTSTSRHQNREVQANITYHLDGIPVGQYTLVTTIRDKNSAKSGSFQTAIEITE